MVFQLVPSQLNRLYWRITYNDIQVGTRLYLGHHQSKIVQEYETFAILLSQAFGGGKEDDKDVNIVNTKDQALASFKEMFAPRT